MKIGIDASRANKFNKTGVERYSYQLIQEFKKISSPTDEVILYSPTPLTGGLENVSNHWMTKVLEWPPRYLWTQLRLSWEMLIHSPDVLFVSAHVLPLITPKRSVVTIHDVAYESYPELYSRASRWYHRYGARKAKRRAHILTVSEFSKREIMKYYQINDSQITVTPLGYDRGVYHREYSEENIKQTLSTYSIQGKFVMYVGRFEAKKNIANILQSFEIFYQHHPEYTLVMAGIPGHGFDEVSELFSSMKEARIIQDLGWISSDDIAQLYTASEALFFPTRYEGFGLPVIEAMACGCPVITSNRTSLPEVGGNAAYYCDPDSVADMVSSLEAVILNPDTQRDLREKGLEHCKKYSWEKTAKLTWEVITAKS